MAGPRGMSVYERHAYEFKLLTSLPVTLPYDPLVARLAACAAIKDLRRDGRCAEAADLIVKYFWTAPQFAITVSESTRGRNNLDYTLLDQNSPDSIKLQVSVTENRTGNDYAELRLSCERLLNILTHILPSDEKELVMQKWDVVKKLIKDYSGNNWHYMHDYSGMIFEPTRDIIKETAVLLQSHGSGLMPCLWTYFYGKPIIRTVFAKRDTYIQYITPPLEFGLSKTSICDTLARAGMTEAFHGCITKIRVHNSSPMVAVSRLMAGVSFQFPDEYCKQAIISYDTPEATTHSSISLPYTGSAL